MPFYKRRRVFKRRVVKKRPTLGRLQKQITKIRRSQEMKFADTAYTTDFTTAGAIVHLSSVAQGDTESTRDGNMITATSLQYVMDMSLASPTSSTAFSSRICRVIIFQDKQQAGDTSPSVTNVLTTADPTSFYQTVTRGRFKIYFDRYFTVRPFTYSNASPANTGLQVAKLYKGKIAFKYPLNIHYNGSAGTDIQRNGLYMLLITSVEEANDHNDIKVRLNYKDS